MLREQNTKSGKSWRLGLRGKFLLMTLIPVIVGFLVMEYYNADNSYRTLQASVGTQLKEINDGFSLDVADQLDMKAMIPKTIASSSEFRSKNETAINQTLLRFMEDYNLTFNLYVAFHDEIKILGAKIEDGVAISFQYNTPADEYRNDPNMVWYYPVQQTHEFSVSMPYFDTGFMQIWMVSLIAPLFNTSDAWNGLTGVDIGLNTFQSAANNYEVGENGFIVLVAPDGTIIAYPDETKWGQPLSGVIATGTFAQDVISKTEGVTTITLGGIEYAVEYHEVSALSKWKSIAFYPSSELYDPIYQNLLYGITIAIVVIGIVTLFLLWSARNVTAPITQLSKISRQISAGDLTSEIKSVKRVDELGSLWNDFTTLKESFADLVRGVQNTAHKVSAASEELASTSEEVSSSSENVAATQQQITKGAQNQAQMVVEAQKLIQNLGDGIKEIKQNAAQITQVVDLITGIANQTNLLALNAAIEAARAGEAGRGFSVVADQVRKLADESKQAVKRTEAMVSQIVRVAEIQSDSAVKVVAAIDNIATVAEETSASTEEASAAAEEQASSMEEITSTAQSLAEIAENLSKQISTFMVDATKKGGPSRVITDARQETAEKPKKTKAREVPPEIS